MKSFQWNHEKNEQLLTERKICFEQIVIAIEEGFLIDIVENLNYGNQKNFIVQVQNYAYLIPFVEDDEKIFLKTIIPSRKATKKISFSNGTMKSNHSNDDQHILDSFEKGEWKSVEDVAQKKINTKKLAADSKKKKQSRFVFPNQIY